MSRVWVLGLILAASAGASVAACVGDSSPPLDAGADATTSDAAVDGASDAGVEADADAGPRTVVQIASGAESGCALLSDGTVWCWGANRVGQLGLGANQFDDGVHATPTQVLGVSGVTAIAAGSYTVCAIEADRSLWCWGQNTHDELGHDNATDPACGGNVKCDPTPTKVAAVAASQVSPGLWETCAVNPTGAVQCWGLDDSGQLGDGKTPTAPATPTPVSVTGLPTVIKSISVGMTRGASVCAIDSSDDLWCWGDNSWGQLGHAAGTMGDVTGAPCATAYCNATPAKVALDPDAGTPFGSVADVRAGWATCAVRTDGTLWCWGNDQTGELGQGAVDKLPHSTPGQIAAFGTTAQHIVGSDALCVLGKSGAVSCWGDSQWGVAGDFGVRDAGCQAFVGNPTGCDSTPRAIASLTASMLDMSQARHALALSIDGGVVGWGDNLNGESGHTPGQSGDIEAGALWLNPTPTPIPLGL